jgi:hypothetical protein
MTRIVGHKIERWMTVEPYDYGNTYYVAIHTRLIELHATKGWRPVRHDWTEHTARHPPGRRDRERHTGTTFVRTRPKGGSVRLQVRP